VIIIDSDGGVDDLLCLVMASRLAAKDIEGITAVFGNVSVDQAVSNIIYSLALVHPPVKPLLGLGAKKHSTASVNSRRRSMDRTALEARGQSDRKVPMHWT
jgi:inosine-uridine nucleoside N-ribohydrolase